MKLLIPLFLLVSALIFYVEWTDTPEPSVNTFADKCDALHGTIKSRPMDGGGVKSVCEVQP